MTPDQDLIEGCKEGKHSAFEALYTKYAKRMMAIALRYCNTTFEAEDIVQESFIKVFEKISTFENKGSFEGWLKRIVVNYSINHFHKTSKERAFEDSSEIEIPDEQVIPVLSELSNTDLLSTLKLLPLGYRTVFNLYVIEGYSHKEIAALCKINEGTSRSQLAKAKILLKEIVLKHSYVTYGK
ncbi:MAG: polymerase, sigma-24 subunit, subfamily protein [Chitinophagaceae bacterium]|nr:polymerase, sigma-24 subunit, subfamily protein [Chitinophagaceae bacterium]